MQSEGLNLHNSIAARFEIPNLYMVPASVAGSGNSQAILVDIMRLL